MARVPDALTCGTKRRYGSLQAARKALRRHTGSAATMHAYRCNCGWFHIGHRTNKKDR